VVKQQELTPGAISVLACIETAAAKGAGIETYAPIARQSGVKHEYVSKIIEQLVRSECLEVEYLSDALPSRRRYVLADGRATQWTTCRGVRPRKMGAARICMCCRNKFLSEWIGNRLCNTCKGLSE